MVRGLGAYSDAELLVHLQADPQAARYWVSLFCRYQGEVEERLQQRLAEEGVSLWRHRVWQLLYGQLLQVDSQAWSEAPRQWFATQVDQILDQQAAPTPPPPTGAESRSGLEEISPILTCYLQLGLEELAADQRFVLVLTDRFRWSAAQISAQLQTEGYSLSPQETEQLVESARQQLFQGLPADVRALYLTSKP